jgi:hypothetical protein
MLKRKIGPRRNWGCPPLSPRKVPFGELKQWMQAHRVLYSSTSAWTYVPLLKTPRFSGPTSPRGSLRKRRLAVFHPPHFEMKGWCQARMTRHLESFRVLSSNRDWYQSRSGKPRTKAFPASPLDEYAMSCTGITQTAYPSSQSIDCQIAITEGGNTTLLISHQLKLPRNRLFKKSQ